jgi:hypothetical protein
MNGLGNFTIQDPLAGQAVTIIITLPASEQTTDQRQALVSVGVATQAPVSKSGVFGCLPDLINEAWKAFGVQAEAAQAQAKARQEAEAARAESAETAVMPDLIAEAETEPDNLTTAASVTTAPRPAANPKPSAPQPAANLGLF